MKTEIYMETERTIMRNLCVDDAKDFYELNLDEDVIKYTGDKPFDSIEKAQDFLSSYDQYEKYGVGHLAVIDKKTNDFLGWCGLKYSEENDEYDIGFRFYKKHWNKGYATETALKNIDFGINKLGLNRIVGRVMTQNIGSIKVLQKIGLYYKKDFKFEGQEGQLFEIKSTDPITAVLQKSGFSG